MGARVLFRALKAGAGLPDSKLNVEQRDLHDCVLLPEVHKGVVLGFVKGKETFLMACGSSEVPTYFEARFRADVQVGSDEDLFSISLGALPGKRYCVTKLSELNLVVKLFESEKDKSEVEMVASLVKSMLAAAGGGGLGPAGLVFHARKILALFSELRGVYVNLRVETDKGSVNLDRFMYFKILDSEPRYTEIKVLSKLPLAPGEPVKLLVKNKSNETVVFQVWGDYKMAEDDLLYEAYLRPGEVRDVELELYEGSYLYLRDLYLRECPLAEYEKTGECSVVGSIPYFNALTLLELAKVKWFEGDSEVTESELGPGRYKVCVEPPPLVPDLDMHATVTLRVILDRKLLPDRTLAVERVTLTSLTDFKVCINFIIDEWSFTDEWSARGIKLELKGYGLKLKLDELPRRR
ncbi:hypothetical protein Igni_0321 [Ignicoccus hospitalis KIN4/I]|uniref:Uncharacterized protein n=1 Tax=Ignicoccus hospitalis (strain KIN4/I / DSM 18386 / JCM 14125) TaxID=453591 RepID=A8A9A2_IGNH4|nr:hypothetical protein Igni_0321 [Ignicoccus hospitalis KIN4/I]